MPTLPQKTEKPRCADSAGTGIHRPRSDTSPGAPITDQKPSRRTLCISKPSWSANHFSIRGEELSGKSRSTTLVPPRPPSALASSLTANTLMPTAPGEAEATVRVQDTPAGFTLTHPTTDPNTNTFPIKDENDPRAMSKSDRAHRERRRRGGLPLPAALQPSPGPSRRQAAHALPTREALPPRAHRYPPLSPRRSSPSRPEPAPRCPTSQAPPIACEGSAPPRSTFARTPRELQASSPLHACAPDGTAHVGFF